jgi:hypothetical protein
MNMSNGAWPSHDPTSLAGGLIAADWLAALSAGLYGLLKSALI